MYDSIPISVTDTLIINIEVNSIEVTNDIAQIKIYPNPTNSILIFDIKDDYKINDYKIELLDETGVVQFQTYILSDLYTIDLTNYNAGIYYLRVFNNNNILQTQKIIKIK